MKTLPSLLLALAALAPAAYAQDEDPAKVEREFREKMQELEKKQQAERREMEKTFRERMEKLPKDRPEARKRSERAPGERSDLDDVMQKLQELRRHVERLQRELDEARPGRDGGDHFEHHFKSIEPLKRRLQQQSPYRRFEFKQAPPSEFRSFRMIPRGKRDFFEAPRQDRKQAPDQRREFRFERRFDGDEGPGGDGRELRRFFERLFDEDEAPRRKRRDF